MAQNMRKPVSTEDSICARLLYISGPSLYSYQFASGEPEVYDYIASLFAPGTPFSRDNVVVEEADERVRGLLLAFPAEEMYRMGKEAGSIIKRFNRIGGLFHTLKILYRMKVNRHFPGVNKDELFVSNLAVFSQYRRTGIATRLLKKAEEIAIENGLSKLSLYLETENDPAKKLYQRFGFEETKRKALPKAYHKHGLTEFRKMVKHI